MLSSNRLLFSYFISFYLFLSPLANYQTWLTIERCGFCVCVCAHASYFTTSFRSLLKRKWVYNVHAPKCVCLALFSIVFVSCFICVVLSFRHFTIHRPTRFFALNANPQRYWMRHQYYCLVFGTLIEFGPPIRPNSQECRRNAMCFNSIVYNAT